MAPGLGNLGNPMIAKITRMSRVPKRGEIATPSGGVGGGNRFSAKRGGTKPQAKHSDYRLALPANIRGNIRPPYLSNGGVCYLFATCSYSLEILRARVIK